VPPVTASRSCGWRPAVPPDDPALTALVGELSVRDQDFRTWWASHRIRGPRRLSKTYRHPIVGALTLDVQQLTVDSRPDQHLIAYTAPPGSPSQEALRFLLQWSAPADDPRDEPVTERNGRR